MATPGSRHHANPTSRFSGRAAAYHDSRPSLPLEIIDAILDGFDRARCTIADLGAGTGLSSLAFADQISGSSQVVAVEANPDMLANAHDHPRVVWRQARAESTGLDLHSIDIVIAVTSYHWFRPDEAAAEVARILRPGGRLAILATDRDPADAAAVEFHRVIGDEDVSITPDNLHHWYGHAFRPDICTPPRLIVAHNPQHFTLDRLIRRAESSSYWPAADAARDRARAAVADLHRRHADGAGTLTLSYRALGLIAERR